MYNKICTFCQQDKHIDLFYKKHDTKDGKSTHCKDCQKVKNKIEQSKPDYLIKRRAYLAKKKNHINSLRKYKYRTDTANRENKKLQSSNYRNNPKNREKIRETQRRIARKNRLNPAFRTVMNLRRRMLFVLEGKRKADHSIKLIGCTKEQLVFHLESLFKSGMGWDNYGHGKGKWCIDHIVACRYFNLALPEEQKKCFHYSNLQPLWFEENAAKDHPLKIAQENISFL